MTQRNDEFEELLDGTLHRRVNTAAPAGMTARITETARRQPVAVVSTTHTSLWKLAIAAGLVLAAGTSFFGWQHRQRVESGPKVATNHAIVPAAVNPAATNVSTGKDIALRNVPLAHRSELQAASHPHITLKPHRPAAEVVESENLPRLDTFPSTAIHPPKPEPGSMEAQLRILISLPRATIEEMAEAQAKSRRASAEQTNATPDPRLD
jgi:hypothetical protein